MGLVRLANVPNASRQTSIFFVRWENKNTKVSAVVSGYGLSEVSRLMFARWSVRVADNGKSIGEVADKLNRKFNLERQ